MKKLIMILMLAIVLVSCSKEEDKQCNCGTIANDGITGTCYWLEITNDWMPM
jgi:PBP1b-binding outer membrane lipoprotein LpoB